MKLVLGWAAGDAEGTRLRRLSSNAVRLGAREGNDLRASVSASRAIAFTAVYKFDFKETIVTGHLQRGQLFVETFSHFTDGSNRFDYYADEAFRLVG